MSIKEITKENINFYLNELSKELRKLNIKEHIEIIIVGGSSILINYTFRNSSVDIDAFYQTKLIKQCANHVADKYNLSSDWINCDFINTSSFSPKIKQYSVFYKTFNHVLDIRTIKSEYLIAMKLKSFRKYKNDISDIVSILNEEKEITLENIKKAVLNLYGSWDSYSSEAIEFINNIFKNKSRIDVETIKMIEDANKKAILKQLKNKR